jgi:hypothetical protein
MCEQAAVRYSCCELLLTQLHAVLHVNTKQSRASCMPVSQCCLDCGMSLPAAVLLQAVVQEISSLANPDYLQSLQVKAHD